MRNINGLKNKAESYLQDTTKYLRDEIESNQDVLKIAGALLIGVAVGAVLGVLFAPDRGSATRENIGSSVREAGNGLSSKVKQGVSSLSKLKDVALDKAQSFRGTTPADAATQQFSSN